jgi:hypothetical protein
MAGARVMGRYSMWPLVAAAVVCALFLAFHVVVFSPLGERYGSALKRAAALGLMVDPSHPTTQLPISPRLFTLLADNSLPAAEAEARGQSGTLTAEMVQALSTIAARRGLETIVAEPGLLTQQSGTVELRAHLRLRGHYADFVGLLDDLARGGRLWTVERFTIKPLTGTSEDIEVWMASCLLKRTGGTS